jgi:hypothetical protein
MPQSTLNLPAGKVLTVTASAASAGSVRRLANAGDSTNYPVQTVAASTSVILGPYTADRSYAVVSDSGPVLAAVISQPDRSNYQAIVTTSALDGAIPIATGAVMLTKGSAGAYTLAAPTAEQDGTIMRLIAGSAFAHVITATGLLQDGVTGGAKNAATFGAFLGSSLTLMAYNLTWYVLAKNVVTIA